jgi:hypothetical protein
VHPRLVDLFHGEFNNWTFTRVLASSMAAP